VNTPGPAQALPGTHDELSCLLATAGRLALLLVRGAACADPGPWVARIDHRPPCARVTLTLPALRPRDAGTGDALVRAVDKVASRWGSVGTWGAERLLWAETGPPLLLTSDEAAELLGIEVCQVIRLERSGTLTAQPVPASPVRSLCHPARWLRRDEVTSVARGAQAALAGELGAPPPAQRLPYPADPPRRHRP
jgi:hypothetical protein